MKIINKYILLLFIAVLAVSCSEDDDMPVAQASSNIQIIVEPFLATSSDVVVQEGLNTMTVDLGFRLRQSGTTYNGSDVNISYGGNTYTIIAGESEVLLGPTEVSFEVNPTGTIPYNGAAVTTDINLDDAYEINVDSRPSDLVVIKAGNISVTGTVYAVVPEVNSDSVELVFMNQDEQASIWFGLSQFTTGGSWVTDFNQNSNGDYPRKMSLPLDGNGSFGAIPNSADVDPDIVALNLYPMTAISNPMGFTILAMYPDGTLKVLNGSISSSPFTDNAAVLVTVTDDAANPGMKLYDLSDM